MATVPHKISRSLRALQNRSRLFCLVSALIFCNISYAEYQLLDQIVAIAEDDAVLASDVRSKMQQIKNTLAQRGATLPPDNILYEQVLERAIIDSLQLQRAYKSGMRISDQELNEAMERIAAQNRVSLQQFRLLLEQQGQSYVAAREQTRKEMLLRNIQQRSVMRKINITESEVENFLNSEQGRTLLEPEYNIDHILLPIAAGASAAEKQSALQNITELQALAADGKFIDIKQQITAAGAQHAPLGWRTLEAVPSLFETTVSELTAEVVSDPISSDSGLHLIKIIAQRGGVQKSNIETLVRHILIKPNEIRNEDEASDLILEIRRQLDEGKSFAALAKQYSDDPGSALAGGELGWNQPGKLVPAFEAMMDITPIGETSQPFESLFGWHIVEVVDRREKDFSTERAQQRARMAIAENKYDDELNNWLQQLRDDSFVEIK